MLVGRPSPALQGGAVIEQAWDLAAVTAGYEAFLADFAPYRTQRARTALDEREAFVVHTRALHLFRGFPFLDPELPDDLMPEPRLRPKVVSAFRTLHADLHDPAARHFAAVAGALSRQYRGTPA
jgi:phenylacetic acid degradation operon negative regulatory protein